MSSKLSKVAIVGLPNVGKSTLFNRLIGRQEAIVNNIPGTTVDRNEGVVEWDGRTFIIFDTAGLEQKDLPIEQQIEQAINEADVVVVVSTGAQGQSDIRKRLGAKPMILVINKIDDFNKPVQLKDGIPISALHGKNINSLLDAIVSHLPQVTSLTSEVNLVTALKIAIVGRPNVGKSTLLNRLLGFERAVVSDIPGTTRDRLETAWKQAILVDTAGIRRQARVNKGIEQQAVARALRAIKESQIVLLLIDTPEGVTQQDIKIARAAINQHKKIIIVYNKADLAKPSYGRFTFLEKIPAVSISATKGTNVETLITMLDELIQNF